MRGGSLAQLISDQPVCPPTCRSLPSEQPMAPADQTPPPPDQKFGEKPQDYSQEFLRQDSVLLHAGEWQFDAGLSYLVFDHNYTTSPRRGGTITAVDSRLTERLLLVPLDARYGISDCLQAFVDVPVRLVEHGEFLSGLRRFPQRRRHRRRQRRRVLAGPQGLRLSCDPDVIATFGITAPTANVSPLQGIIEPPNTLLGQGFWFGHWNVMFIHTIDPIILFYGFGSRHGLSTEFEGFDITPGAQYFYRAGVGFAVNERITLSAALIGSYVTDPELNGVRIAGLADEPISLRFADHDRPAVQSDSASPLSNSV